MANAVVVNEMDGTEALAYKLGLQSMTWDAAERELGEAGTDGDCYDAWEAGLFRRMGDVEQL